MFSTDKSELLFACVPFFEGQTDRPFREFVARLELRRAVASFTFKLRQPTESAEKTLVGHIQANNHRVKGVAWNPCPVLLGAFQQLRQVRLQAIPSGVFAVDAVIAFFQLQEVVMHVAQDRQACCRDAYSAGVRVSDIYRFSRFYQLPVFNPSQVGGRHIALQQCLTCLPTGKKSVTFLTLFVKIKRSGHSSPT